MLLAPLARLARADEPAVAPLSPSIDVNYWRDTAITLGAMTAAQFARFIPVDTTARWEHQLLPFDNRATKNFSASADTTSNTLFALTVMTPLALQIGQGLGPETAKRCLVYDETLMISLMATSFTKRLVGRPRPYVYNTDPRVAAYAQSEALKGQESHVSFFSGHANEAFSGAVAGGYLFAQGTDDIKARTAVWVLGLGLAGATADLRVRAGKHFYSDVLVGAGVGSALGAVVPYLHYRGRPRHSLSRAEWVAIVLAPLAGFALGQALPLAPSNITEPL